MTTVMHHRPMKMSRKMRACVKLQEKRRDIQRHTELGNMLRSSA